ncbi:hypothetical protein KSP39_PZI006000 [Platanthera zijinensis]|uniref:Uncharacterized protein n=1 Tax=Platanthera zijinensis TaxID=2320716 RepID=A0AAP0BTI2_9ASPA
MPRKVHSKLGLVKVYLRIRKPKSQLCSTGLKRWMYHHYFAIMMTLMSLNWEIKGQLECSSKQHGILSSVHLVWRKSTMEPVHAYFNLNDSQGIFSFLIPALPGMQYGSLLLAIVFVAELVGIYMLVFFRCGASIAWQSGSITLVGAALTWAVVVTAIVYSIAHISSSHINPAASSRSGDGNSF